MDEPKTQTGFFKNKRNLYLVYAAMVITITTVLIGSIFFFALKNKKDEGKLSNAETQELLGNILKNNPIGIIQGKGNTNPVTNNNQVKDLPGDPSSPEANSPIPAPKIYSSGKVKPVTDKDLLLPDTGEINYRYSVSRSIAGIANTKCEAYSVVDNLQSEHFDYFDAKHSFYKYKSVVNGRLDSYYLGLYGNDINEYYAHKGGTLSAQYLMQIDTDFDNSHRLNPNSYANSTPVSVPDSLPQNEIGEYVYQYFGGDAKVTDYVEDADPSYFEVTVTRTVSCDLNSYNYDNTIIDVYKITEDDFKIFEKKTYFQQKAAANLMNTTIYKGQNSFKHYDDIYLEFEFEFDTDLAVLNYRDYKYDPVKKYKRITNYLAEQEIDIFLPSNENFELAYLTGKSFPKNVSGERYYLKREYYPNDEQGQQEFEAIRSEHRLNPIVSNNLFIRGVDYSHLAIKTFKKPIKTQQVLDKITPYQYGFEPDSSDVKLKINTEEHIADKLSVIFWESLDKPQSFPVSYFPDYPDSIPVSFPTSYGDNRYRFYWNAFAVPVEGYYHTASSWTPYLTYLEYIPYETVNSNKETFKRLNELMQDYFEIEI